MLDNRDRYQAYYQDKLWNLLPAIYRSLDTDSFSVPGPLREMVNRIGAQAAILRRSIDRLWTDQSIETCDDWVIAYIADLVATNLVASLDARGQRLDVAKTIYYRRRKGTVAILEEIAVNITGWNARVVEFFRRIGRTRHNFDPEIGLPSETPNPAGALALQREEGLVGRWTHTGAGGWADLRNAYGATKSRSAFDEFAHTADFRFGRDMVGWHNIPRLGVFLWRLYSFDVDPSTPVAVTGCPSQFTFDPTGREIPLFAAASRSASASFADQWVSPQEWELPGLIAAPLLQAALTDPQTIPLYATVDPTDGVTLIPRSLGVFQKPAADYLLLDETHFIDPTTKRITIYPELGRFHVLSAPAGQLFARYHYGFSSPLGAGPYDRRVPGVAPVAPPQPVTTISGGDPATVTVPSPKGTTILGDSLTYSNVNDGVGLANVKIQAAAERRPVLRFPAPHPDVPVWTLAGQDSQSDLTLEGLLVSGGDIVLSGKFAKVTLSCCTLDPGNPGDPAASTPAVFAQSMDQRDLRPCRLWIEAEIAALVVDRCITGPIRTRNGGSVEKLQASDSILQGIRTSGTGLLTAADIQDPMDLALALRAPGPVAVFVDGFLDAATTKALKDWDGTSALPGGLLASLVTGLNAALGAALYQPKRLDGVPLSPATLALLAAHPMGADLTRLNRLLLEEVFPVALGQPALALASGEVDLSRCTVLGRLVVHRLEASECILDDFSVVEDTQYGCVRFSAWPEGSVLPRQYESAQVPERSSIFTSRDYGQPGYAQLLPSADRAILSPAGATILTGATDGSEMGAFAREKNPIKERSLLIKYQEFMPLGLVPVVVHVT